MRLLPREADEGYCSSVVPLLWFLSVFYECVFLIETDCVLSCLYDELRVELCSGWMSQCSSRIKHREAK